MRPAYNDMIVVSLQNMPYSLLTEDDNVRLKTYCAAFNDRLYKQGRFEIPGWDGNIFGDILAAASEEVGVHKDISSAHHDTRQIMKATWDENETRCWTW